jgi:hypothetical protein
MDNASLVHGKTSKPKMRASTINWKMSAPTVKNLIKCGCDAGLITDAGKYRRQTGVNVRGKKVIHLAPPPKRSPSLMGDLFDYLVNYREDIIIKSCVFHFRVRVHSSVQRRNGGRMGRVLADRYS